MAHPPTTPPSPPRIGELFAGYGGLGMGVQAVLGGSIAWFSEFDKGPSKILEHRFPGVPNLGDITKIDWAAIEPVDILTGGSPCQDLSNAGKRAGMTEGTRSNLWVAMREAIAHLRPPLVVWENVRGAYSAEAASGLVDDPRLLADTRRRDGEPVLRALGRVLGDLSDLGYDASWHGIRAADVGAPHGRFRVFVVAWDASRDNGRHGSLAADDRPRRDQEQARAADRTTADAADLGHEWPGRARDGRTGSADGDSRTLTLLPTPRASDGEKGGPNQRGSSGDLMLPAAVQPERLLPTPTSADSKASGAAGYNGNEFCTLTDSTVRQPDKWGDYAAAIAHWEHVLGRPAPAPTMTSAKGNPQLSPAFVEWMMGLPAGWVADVPGITRNEALKALGNGVVPQQAAAALREMFAWEQVAA